MCQRTRNIINITISHQVQFEINDLTPCSTCGERSGGEVDLLMLITFSPLISIGSSENWYFSPHFISFLNCTGLCGLKDKIKQTRLADSAELMNDVWLRFSSNVKSRWWKAEPYLHRSCSTYKEISTHSQDQQWHRPRRERTLFCSPICRVPSLSVRKPSGGGRRVGAGRLPCFSGWWRVRAPVLSMSAWACLMWFL